MVNGKEYVGQAESLYNRNYTELSALNGGYFTNKHLQRSWDKYGADNFVLSILFDNLSVSQLDDYEQMAILLRDLPDHSKGYNDTCGGHGSRGYKHNDETRKKMSDILLNKFGGIKPCYDELYDLYINKKLTIPVIGDMFNVANGTMSVWLHEYNIPVRTTGESLLIRSGGVKPSKEELYNNYCVDYLTTYEIADKYGVGDGTISVWLKEYGIEARTISESKLLKNGGVKPSYDELYHDYCVDCLTTIEIGRKYGVSDNAIVNYLNEYNIPVRSNSEAQLIKRGGFKPSKDELYDLYINQGLTPDSIGDLCNVSGVSIRNWIKEYDIPYRGRSKIVKGGGDSN
jgi:group I intron endonuclease